MSETYPRENLTLYIEKYAGLRRIYAEGTPEYQAYNQVTFTLQNSRTLQEAKEHITEDYKNHDDTVARNIYSMFLREGITQSRSVNVQAPRVPKEYGMHTPMPDNNMRRGK